MEEEMYRQLDEDGGKRLYSIWHGIELMMEGT